MFIEYVTCVQPINGKINTLIGILFQFEEAMHDNLFFFKFATIRLIVLNMCVFRSYTSTSSSKTF